ncbi:hypothetical protein ACLMJK_007408 [Lecanora helva]
MSRIALPLDDNLGKPSHPTNLSTHSACTTTSPTNITKPLNTTLMVSNLAPLGGADDVVPLEIDPPLESPPPFALPEEPAPMAGLVEDDILDDVELASRRAGADGDAVAEAKSLVAEYSAADMICEAEAMILDVSKSSVAELRKSVAVSRSERRPVLYVAVGIGPASPGKVMVPPPPEHDSPIGQQPLGTQSSPTGQPAPPSLQQW